MTGKALSVRTIVYNLICSTIIISCASSPAVSKIPVAKKGKMSTAVLAMVNRQNAVFDGEQVHIFPDGLEFYFIIYPVNTDIFPTIKQYQNFTIDKEPYWQNIPGLYNSHTVIYNERTFIEHEPEALSIIKMIKNTKVFVQKTIICGQPLPSEGIVSYQLFFGFGETLEEFEFRFNLTDIL